jgi:hypothetical protein
VIWNRFNPTASGLSQHAAVPPPRPDPAPEDRLAGNGVATMVHETSEELGEALHGKFVQLLTDKLRSKDGRLSPADVAEMGEAFRRELKVIETVFLDAIKSYTQGRMEGRKAQNRSRLFHRLLMRKFEDRFADERALKDKPNFLSRRMLPGFFHMLPLMFGKPKLDTYEKQTEKVAERLGGTADGVLDWSTF